MMVESLSSRLSSLPQRWILSLLKFWKRNPTQCSQIFWWICIMIFWTKLSLCDICLISFGDITIVVFITIPDWRKSRKNKCCPNLALVWIHFTYRPGNMCQKCEGLDLNIGNFKIIAAVYLFCQLIQSSPTSFNLCWINFTE